MEKGEDRTEFARELRKYTSDVCSLVNLSHTLYRFKQEEEDIPQQGGIVS
jgi:hypothetical protein